MERAQEISPFRVGSMDDYEFDGLIPYSSG